MCATGPWAGLVRVSHVGGRGGDSFHADAEQVAEIERYASAHGLALELLQPELDVSGGWELERRPSLLAAVQGVESGRYAGIIVAYLSRLGRNVREQLAVWDRVETAGGRIVVVREGIDTSTAHGRMHRTILLAIAEGEREQHAERFEARRQAATEAGIWQRRQVPRGYRRDPDTRRLVIDETTAGGVRDVFRQAGAGASISGLAREIGMTKSGVRKLLANRVYLGELRVGRHVNPDAHPALVDAATWQAAQRSVPVRPGRGEAPALLAGLVRCSGCGHTMSRTRTGGDRVAYSCRRHHSAGECPAPASITTRLLDEAVAFTALVELGRLRISSSQIEGQITEAEAEVERAEQELAKYVETVQVAGLDGDAFVHGARARQAQLDEARAVLEAALARVPQRVLGDPIEAWKQMDGSQRNHVLRGLIDCVLVRRVGRGQLVPVAERARIIRRGVGLVTPYRGGGGAHPLVQVDFDDIDDDALIRVLGREDLP